MFDKKVFADGEMCPLIKDKCVRHQCAWFTKVLGTNPQTGKDIEDWGCSIAWLPILLVENSNQQRQTAASVDKVANQVLKQRSEFMGALPQEAKERMIRSDVKVIE